MYHNRNIRTRLLSSKLILWNVKKYGSFQHVRGKIQVSVFPSSVKLHNGTITQNVNKKREKERKENEKRENPCHRKLALLLKIISCCHTSKPLSRRKKKKKETINHKLQCTFYSSSSLQSSYIHRYTCASLLTTQQLNLLSYDWK